MADSTAPWLAILNPRARGGAADRLARGALWDLRERGIQIELLRTTGPWEAVRLAREGYARGYRRFLAIGGDGTAFEVLNGFLPPALDDGAETGMAVLPVGTGNSFARHFARERAEAGAGDAAPDTAEPFAALVDAIAGGEPQRCDVLRLHHSTGDHYALGTICVGFPAQVSALVNSKLKRLGVPGYTLGVLLELLRLQAYVSDLTFGAGAERKSVRGRLLLAAIQNVEWVGGNMKMAPGALAADGLADLIVVDAASRLRVLRLFPRIFHGTHIGVPEVHLHRCSEVGFHTDDRRPVMLDGEVLELAPKRLEVLPGAISVWA